MASLSTFEILAGARLEHGAALLPLVRGARPDRGPIRYADSREYTSAVRHLGRRLGYDDELLSRDGRLLAAGWNYRPPRDWLRVLPGYLAYWDALAIEGRPVGSCYHDPPESVRAAWDLGIPVEQYPIMGSGWAWQLLPDPRHGTRVSRERVRCVLALARRRALAPPHRVSIRDLRALVRLPGWLLRAGRPWSNGGVDWEDLAETYRRLFPVQGRLEAARIPATGWNVIAYLTHSLAVLSEVGLGLSCRQGNWSLIPLDAADAATVRGPLLELRKVTAREVVESVLADDLHRAAEMLPRLKALAEIEIEDEQRPSFGPLLDTLRSYLRSKIERR